MRYIWITDQKTCTFTIIAESDFENWKLNEFLERERALEILSLDLTEEVKK